MRIGTAFIFVCAGVYIAYNYPEVGQMMYAYIQLALSWIMATFEQINGG